MHGGNAQSGADWDRDGLRSTHPSRSLGRSTPEAGMTPDRPFLKEDPNSETTSAKPKTADPENMRQLFCPQSECGHAG